ncbi:MAG: hypothetical protein GWP08_19015 [Nitrospiraceae bacterium]|nr:hypothetical protein [Nitrospiraceae bacterium]
MAKNDLHPDPNMEQIDADAVCAECSTVSPEGTLICRHCGNNLRDQRARRFSAVEQGGELTATLPSRSRFVRGGLMAFGLLVVLWTAFNAGRIEEMFLKLQMDETRGTDAFWAGSESGDFDALRAELNANPVTDAEVKALLGGASGGEGLDGRYVLLNENKLFGPTKIGEAIAQTDGDALRFVVLLARGKVELRGVGQFDGDSRITAPEGTVGLSLHGKYYGAAGFAQVVGAGTLECHGLTAYSEETYAAMAFRVP